MSNQKVMGGWVLLPQTRHPNIVVERSVRLPLFISYKACLFIFAKRRFLKEAVDEVRYMLKEAAGG